MRKEEINFMIIIDNLFKKKKYCYFEYGKSYILFVANNTQVNTHITIYTCLSVMFNSTDPDLPLHKVLMDLDLCRLLEAISRKATQILLCQYIM